MLGWRGWEVRPGLCEEEGEGGGGLGGGVGGGGCTVGWGVGGPWTADV